MKFSDFIQGLLPTIKKSNIEEDIRITRSEILETTQPSYETAALLFKSWKFKSKELEDQVSMFSRMVKGQGGDNIIATISKGFKPMLENLDNVEELIKKSYGEEVAGKGLTYFGASLLRYLQAMTFVSKYARKFLIYVYVCETAEFEESKSYFRDSLAPVEIEWIKANFLSFCTAFAAVTNNPAHTKKAFDDIPDVVVTSDNEHTLASTVGTAKIDPLQMRLIPIWMNPIYHIGMFVAEWQADRYKSAKDEVKLLELRKLNLEKLKAGKPDASIQKQIDYMEGRIRGMSAKIDKMEKEHA